MLGYWLAMKSSSIPNVEESCELILHQSCPNLRKDKEKGKCVVQRIGGETIKGLEAF